MQRLSKLGMAAALAVALAAPGAAQAQAACTWVTTDLPLADGFSGIRVSGSSDNGEWVLGEGYHSQHQNATVVWRDGVVHGVHPESAKVFDVNNSGTVVGMSDSLPFRIENGVREQLEPATGKTQAIASHINNSGAAAGQSGPYSLYGPLLVWEPGSTTPRELPGTRNGLVRFVKGFDDQGNVVAQEVGPLSRRISHVWDRNGNQTRLEPLPGDYSAYVESISGGRIFGTSVHAEPLEGRTVVEWGLDGKIVRTIPELADVYDSNAAGEVLGQAAGDGVGLWRSPGEYVPVTADLWPDAVDESGAVYGYGYRPGNDNQVPRYARCG
ncbi:hypothetical protein ACIA8G_39200 [Lentzea sp. NPDC051213]|uniref:hypothetical protein n=1 Tax=Lentzea sp. NPDC051213 TaxID=3364126 RepID=UPI0037BD33F1